MCLDLNQPKYVDVHSNSNTTSKHAPTQVEGNYVYCMQDNQLENQEGKLSRKSSIKLKDNSIEIYIGIQRNNVLS